MTAKPTQLPRAMTDKFNDHNWGAEQLREISVFKLFSKKELIELYKRGHVQTLRPDSHAVIEGEPTRGVYIIFHGQVSVYKNDLSNGAMYRIANLDEGTTFGEMSLFDRAPRSATVKAETFCYLFYLDAKVFEDYLEEAGDNLKFRFYKTCAENLSERFRAINSDYIESQQLLWKYALRREDQDS